MGKFSDYEYRKQPGFDMNTSAGANQAIPMKTLVIHCFDPRAVDIPQAVADTSGKRDGRFRLCRSPARPDTLLESNSAFLLSR